MRPHRQPLKLRAIEREERPNDQITFTVAVMASLVLPPIAATEDVPDALSVEWQGKKPCEKLQ
jgi:hypothetical protein